MGSRFPSIAMREARRDIYLVLDDFGGRLGRAWRETDEAASTREILIRDLMDGQYHNPACIVAFNAAEGWSRDVSEDVAYEVSRRCAGQARDLPSFLVEFVTRYHGTHHDVQ